MKFNSTRVISIASGKGGVGKTLSTVNMALTFANEGYSVTILDGDFGLANVDVVMGLEARYNIEDVLANTVPISDIVLRGPLGINVIPASSGFTKINELSLAQKISLFDQISEFDRGTDFLIIDSGAGISLDVLHLNSLASDQVIVTTPEPHALTDAYALVKVMSQKYQRRTFNFVINMARSGEEGLKIFAKLSEVMERFLGVSANLLGVVPRDELIRRDIMARNVINADTTQRIAGQAWKDCALQFLSSVKNHGDQNRGKIWQDLLLRNAQTDMAM